MPWWERFRSEIHLDSRNAAAIVRRLIRFFKMRRRDVLYGYPERCSGRTNRKVTLRWTTENWIHIPVSGSDRRCPETFIALDIEDRLNRSLDRFIATTLDGYALRNKWDEASFKRLSALVATGRRLAALLGETEAELYQWVLAPRRVIRENVCITLDRLPPEIQEAIRRQSPGPAGRSAPVSPGHTTVVDSGRFDEPLRSDIIRLAETLGEPSSGLLIKGDNGDALHYLLPRFKESIRCIYIDPPFNTGSAGFAYRDNMTSEGWLTMMDNRLEWSRPLLTHDGSLFVHIAGDETARLRLLLDRRFIFINEIIWRIGWVSGFKVRAKRFIRNHDTIYYYARSRSRVFNKQYLPYGEGYARRGGSKGRGMPLEDTWNCRADDPLNSIQIMSFSREKVGRGDATQKNENVLNRIIASVTHPGDWVLDYFAGTGTTCATAMKIGRRWIGVELPGIFESVLLPRMKKALGGDPFGISPSVGWKGGGWFRYLALMPGPASVHVSQGT